jgi:ADP-ribose pyrophosphatase YjhB (NUDIX family)
VHTPSTQPLVREVADAIIIITETNPYLMKRRDDPPWLIFPNQWSFFGGGIELRETPEEALRGELIEELAFRAGEVEFFADWWVTLPFPTPRVEHVNLFAVPIAAAEIADFVLSDGPRCGCSSPKNLPRQKTSCPSILPRCCSLRGGTNSSGCRRHFPASRPRRRRAERGESPCHPTTG